jgi:hypothetical protein
MLMKNLSDIFAELYLVDLDTLDEIIVEAERIRAERRRDAALSGSNGLKGAPRVACS